MRNLISIEQDSNKEIDLNDKYLNSGGLRCPHCNSSNISANGFEADADYIWRDVDCGSCGAEWKEEYKLVGAFNFEIPQVIPNIEGD